MIRPINKNNNQFNKQFDNSLNKLEKIDNQKNKIEIKEKEIKTKNSIFKKNDLNFFDKDVSKGSNISIDEKKFNNHLNDNYKSKNKNSNEFLTYLKKNGLSHNVNKFFKFQDY